MLLESGDHQHVLKNSRKTIAVIGGSMVSSFQDEIMNGAAYAAAEKDCNFIGFSGGTISSDDPLALGREKVFDLVNMELIDGIISPFSSLMRHLSKQACQEFIDRLSSVPIVNIGSHISGYTSVIVDYEAGFVELFEHFYNVHGFRKILFVRGPEHHASSEKRMNIYKTLLKRYGLPFDDEMIIYSDLNRVTAKASFKCFLDKAHKPFDAVITLNDSQALGVIDACREVGIQIPKDVAVVGSMNTSEGAFSVPSLTSIQEAPFELGYAAVIELVAQIEGKAASEEIKMPTSLFVRQSCGCDPSVLDEVEQLEPYKVSKLSSVGQDPIFEEIKTYTGRIVEQYKGGIIQDEVTSLLVLYRQAILYKDLDCFLERLQKKLKEAFKSEDIMLWLMVTTKLELSTLQYLEQHPEQQHIVTCISRLISLKNEIEQSAIKFKRFETEYYLNYFRNIVNNLNTSFDLSRIKKYTVDILQLSELYISLFNDLNADIVTARNIVSVHNNKFIELEDRNFIANKLLPDGIDTFNERFSLIVFPLSFRKKVLGFLTVNLTNSKGTAFENLRAIISSALKNEVLIQDLQNAEERFSDIAHSTSNWLWETDINNRFTYCSDSSFDIIGYSPDELFAKEITELNAGEIDSYITNMLSYEDLIDYECWYKHQNGKVICLLISAKPIIKEGMFNGYRGVFEDITEQKLQEEKIKNLAYSDTLTGLPNRALFQSSLAEALIASSKNNNKFALMFIDLDRFKHINDLMGHAAGDLLLIELGKRLSLSIRACDLLARLGGDEFVIILKDIVNEGEVIEIVERILLNVQDAIFVNNKSMYCTLSMGISLFPNDGVDAQTLLQKGDSAMYQAKSQGRNGFVFYNKLLEEKSILRNMYEEILREAIATDGFVLHYQPQVSVETGCIIGFEALVRIKSQKRGIIEPDNFISLAEELGLISQVDEWAFKEACAQYAKWRALGLSNVKLSINLSALQLRNDSVLSTYIAILKSYDIDPKNIQLEITENALIENEHIAKKIIEGFKDYGISIALDDFGTGFSSLNCINLYPIDTIKIDSSFVKDVLDNPKNKAIIKGIVLIASSLNLDVIAEGVETLEQFALMKKLGCNEIQGYHFYKPCSAEEAQILLPKM